MILGPRVMVVVVFFVVGVFALDGNALLHIVIKSDVFLLPVIWGMKSRCGL